MATFRAPCRPISTFNLRNAAHKYLNPSSGAYFPLFKGSLRTSRAPRQAARAELPQKLVEARKLRKQGLTASVAFLAVAAALVPALNLQTPEPPDWILPALATALGVPALALAVTKAALGDRLSIEVHEGRVYIQWDVPPADAPRLPSEAVEVRPAGKKGNGAFAIQPIRAATYLGDYEGELLDEVAYWQRYPDGVADYCIGIDGNWTVDGRDRALDTSVFSPCHMNHSSSRFNVVRFCRRAERRVSFFAARDIEAGEELLLDYGKTYWTGREELVID